jgi:uncharacterized protein
MGPQLTADEILRQLRADKTFLRLKFGVIDIGLFGSFAKGQSGHESDIDFIVELQEPKFEWLAGLQIYLEGKFNRKIELIRKGSHINEGFTNRIEKETLYA